MDRCAASRRMKGEGMDAPEQCPASPHLQDPQGAWLTSLPIFCSVPPTLPWLQMELSRVPPPQLGKGHTALEAGKGVDIKAPKN